MNPREVILCIDDEPAILHLIKGQLVPTFADQFDLRFAGDAEEAIAIVDELRANKQPLVMAIVDQLLPGKLGHEFLAEITEYYPNVIKILFSGKNDFDVVIRAINEAQIFRYLIKPWKEEDFISIIQRGLKQYYVKESVEVQLAELHHRVKNNLTVITCLLELQSGELKDESSKSYFQQSINRINSIAKVHELIYDSDDMASVDINNYLSRIIPSIEASVNNTHKDVSIVLDIPKYRMKVQQAIPLGLLFNELITNSFMYAFPQNYKGSITIKMVEEWNRIHFTFEDNGIGFKSGIQFEDSNHLGLTLVRLQLQQLECTYSVDTKDKFHLEFSFDALKVKSIDNSLGLENLDFLFKA